MNFVEWKAQRIAWRWGFEHLIGSTIAQLIELRIIDEVATESRNVRDYDYTKKYSNVRLDLLNYIETLIFFCK